MGGLILSREKKNDLSLSLSSLSSFSSLSPPPTLQLTCSDPSVLFHAPGATPVPALSSSGVGAAIDALCALKGVGPATATALVSAADPSVPFLSDEALTAVLGAREYSRPAALRVTAALRQRAEELNGVQQQQEGKGKEEKGKSCSSSSSWTASKVERALWSASRAEDDEGEGEAKGEEGKKEVEANEEKEKEKKKKKRKLL